MKKAASISMMLVAGAFLTLAIAPTASAGTSVVHTCTYSNWSGEYQCSGYGINNAGEVCYVEWSDDDANDNWEDSNSHIKEQTCGGELIEEAIGGGSGDGT